jgi:hypothetical protein
MFIVCSGSNPTGDVNVIMGIINGEPICFNVNNFTPEQKNVYDEFFSVVGLHSSTIIENCPFSFAVSHVTKLDVGLDMVTIDFDSLGEDEKNKIQVAVEVFLGSIPNQ